MRYKATTAKGENVEININDIRRIGPTDSTLKTTVLQCYDYATFNEYFVDKRVDEVLIELREAGWSPKW